MTSAKIMLLANPRNLLELLLAPSALTQSPAHAFLRTSYVNGPSRVTMLSPCLRMMPNPKVALENTEKRFRRRHVDLLANPERREIFRTRAAIVRELRRFLEERDFLEVETPILGAGYGGASARDFNSIGRLSVLLPTLWDSMMKLYILEPFLST